MTAESEKETRVSEKSVNKGSRRNAGPLFTLPTLHQLSCASRRKHGENLAQALADVLYLGSGVRRERDCGLCFVGLSVCAQLLAGAGAGESLLVELLLDAQDAFDVALAVHALTRAALHRLELRELGFPETQDIGRQTAQGGYFADAEV